MNVPEFHILQYLEQNFAVTLVLVTVFLLWCLLPNIDKLFEAFGGRRRWEAEKARLEATHTYWQLEAYKREQGFSDLPDPWATAKAAIPATPGVREEPAVRASSLTYRERFSYASAGGYLALSTLYLATLTSEPRPESIPPFWGALLAMTLIALLSGVLTATQKRVPDIRARLLIAGAGNTIWLILGFGTVIISLMMLLQAG